MSSTAKARTLTHIALLTEIAEELAEEEAKEAQCQGKKKREWTKSWLKRRNDPESWCQLYTEVEESDISKFQNVFRLPPDVFNDLLQLVGPIIEKEDTTMRQAIPAKLRLMVGLRYLTSGSNFGTLEDIFRISKVTISLIVPEVCQALWDALHEDYIKCPRTPNEWMEKAARFQGRWQYPRGLGAIDGKHIQIQAPGNSGSVFHNYKGTFSIVLLAVADADYKFMYIDIGTEGASNDAGIFDRSNLKDALHSGELGLPAVPPDDPLQVPYHLLADDAFGLSERVMKPYPNKSTEARQKVFNYRFSRGRRVVENSFGIMAARCFVLRGPILQNYTNAVKTAKACVVFHNYVLTKLPPAASKEKDEEVVSGLPGVQAQPSTSRGTHQARLFRDTLADHFMSAGQGSNGNGLLRRQEPETEIKKNASER